MYYWLIVFFHKFLYPICYTLGWGNSALNIFKINLKGVVVVYVHSLHISLYIVQAWYKCNKMVTKRTITISITSNNRIALDKIVELEKKAGHKETASSIMNKALEISLHDIQDFLELERKMKEDLNKHWKTIKKQKEEVLKKN